MDEQKLPLWNDDDTDILPEYQLSSGHVLLNVQLGERSVKLLAKSLGVGHLVASSDFDYKSLPYYESVGKRYFGTEQNAHIVVVNGPGCCAVFGPHKLFGGSGKWLEWNEWRRRWFMMVHQLDLDEFSFLIFSGTARKLSLYTVGTSVKFPEHQPFEFWIDGKVTYRHKPKPEKPTKRLMDFFYKDIQVQSDGDRVWFVNRSTDEQIDNSQVRHYVFQRSEKKSWFP